MFRDFGEFTPPRKISVDCANNWGLHLPFSPFLFPQNTPKTPDIMNIMNIAGKSIT